MDNPLANHVGPLPLWGWGAVAAGTVGIALFIKRKLGGSGAISGTAAATSAGGAPATEDFGAQITNLSTTVDGLTKDLQDKITAQNTQISQFEASASAAQSQIQTLEQANAAATARASAAIAAQQDLQTRITNTLAVSSGTATPAQAAGPRLY